MTIQIPDKLKRENIRFILVQPRDKKPFEMAWILNDIEWEQQEDKRWKNKKTGKIYIIPKTGEIYKGELHSYRYDDPKLLSWLDRNGNYGVSGGNGLILIDFDNAEVEEKALKLLPETFTVLTGSKRLHLYYFTDGEESYKGFDASLNTLFDAQSSGKQCVGAGSQHPNGNYYEVVKDKDIAFIEYKKLRELLSSYDQKPAKEVKETSKYEKVEYKKVGSYDNTFLETLKRTVTPEIVLNKLGVDTTSNPCGCPLHSSKGGHCLGYNDVTVHCFHCQFSGNAFTLIKAKNKCSFKEALEIMVDYANMRKEYEENKTKYLEDWKTQKIDFVILEKKKDEETAANKGEGYKAGKLDLAGTNPIIDANGKVVDPAADAALSKLTRRQTMKKKALCDKVEETKEDTNRISFTREEKEKLIGKWGTLKINDEENPYK
jgi:hypothetical protein